jgi:carbon storage regulator
MLILSRKSKERIFIDSHIRITVLEIRGNYVRIGIEAPADVLILREEIAPGSVRSRSTQGGSNRST